jgi:hypothetical protein
MRGSRRQAFEPISSEGERAARAEFLGSTASSSSAASSSSISAGLTTARAQSYGTGAGAGPSSSTSRGDRVAAALYSGGGSGAAEKEADPLLVVRAATLAGSGPWAGGGDRNVPHWLPRRTDAYFCCGRLTRRACTLVTLVSCFLVVLVSSLVGYYVAAPVYVRGRIAATTLTFTSLTLSAPRGAGLGGAGRGPRELSWARAVQEADAALLRRATQQQLRRGGEGEGVESAEDASSSSRSLLAAAADEPYGFTLTINAILSGLEPVDGTLGSFEATMRFGGAEVARLVMPALDAKAGVDNYLTFAAPVSVTSLQGFRDFGDAIVNSAVVTAELDGVTSVSTSVAGTRVEVDGVTFQKSVSFAGANGLPGSTVSSFSLARSNATAAVVDLTVAVQNPSGVAIAPLGDVGVRIYYKGVDMGTASATNATLLPGVSNLTLSGVLASTNVSATEELISAYLGRRAVTVTAIGEALPSSIPLYSSVLSSLVLSASLDGATAEPLIAGIAVESMYLVPEGADAVGIRLNVTVSVNNLLGGQSPITVKSVALNCSLEGDGQSLGRIIVPDTPVTATGPARLLSSSSDDPALPLLNISIGLSATLSLSATNTRFADFVLDFLRRPSVSIGLVSDNPNSMQVSLSCVLGDLLVGIPIEARTDVPGIGGFPFVSVDSFSVIGTQQGPPPAILAGLNVSLLNPSPATFPLGANATLGIYVGSSRLGYSVIYNRTLVPQLNVLELVGVLAPAVEALPDAGSLFSSYLSGRNSTVTVVGESVFLEDGQGDTPSWLVAAVQNISLAATLPGLDPVAAAQLLVNASVEDLYLDFGDDGMASSPGVEGTVRAVLQLPFSVPVGVGPTNVSLSFVEPSTGIFMAALNLTQQTAGWYPCNTTEACASVVDLDAEAVRRNGGPGVELARRQYVAAAVKAGQAGLSSGAPGAPRAAPASLPLTPLFPVGVLYIRLSRANLTVLDAPAFSRLVSSVVNDKFVSLRLSGTASPLVTMAIGAVPITGVRVEQDLVLPGMNGFSDPPIQVIGGDITNTSASTVSLTVTFNISNTAPLRGRLGPVSVGVSYQNASFITASLPSLSIERGANLLASVGTFRLPDKVTRYSDYLSAKDVLSRFLRGLSSNVTVLGLPDSSPNPLLQPGTSSLKAAAGFPGMPEKLLQNATLFLAIDPFNLPAYGSLAPGSLVITNVLSVDLILENASLLVSLCRNETGPKSCEAEDEYTIPIGYFYNGSLKDTPAGRPLSPARSTVASPLYNITLLADLAADLAIFLDLLGNGDLVTRAEGNITATLVKPATNSSGRSEPFTEQVFYDQSEFVLFNKDPSAA